jgi:hypothetical protein
MNTLTKGVVMASTLAAALFDLYLASQGLTAVRVAGLVLLAAAVAGWLTGRRVVVSTILFLIYLAPVAWLLWYGSETYSFEVAWIVPVVGVTLLGRDAWRWSIPRPWRWPLVTWALAVAVSWPIVALRELSFDPGMLWVRGSTNVAGVSPAESAMWSTHVALGHLVGLLWVDALWRWYASGTRDRFVREIVWPLAGAAVIAAAVGAYQGFVRIDFLSGHVWPYMNRATGTLMDANTFGTVMAFWGPGLLALLLGAGARGREGGWRNGGARWGLLAAAFVLSFAGVWTSGSRTALAGFMLVMAVAAHYLWTERLRGRTTRVPPLAVTAAALGLIAIVALVAFVARGSSTTSVFARIPSLVPGMQSDASLGRTIVDLWQRFGYGTAAMRMIGEHPLQGVGVGGFHTLVRDYSMLVTDQSLAPDNAQSWYRHVLAELGVLGSAGALVWTLVFARRLFSKATRTSPDAAARIGAGVLVAFGLLSLFGVPGQSASIVLTFWVFAYWVATALGNAEEAPAAGRWPIAATIAVLLMVGIHAALTFASARTDLLPAHRAGRFGWDYSFGISSLERSPDGLDRRWTAERSLSTLRVEGRVLKFVAWAEHPDANERPVHLRVIAGGKQVFEGDLQRQSAIRLDIPATPGAKTMVLETFIDRTFRPSDYGSRDRRDLGLAILDWRWE